MKALILAGGFGTRLQSIVKDVPKPMALIAGKPFLEHQINFLKNQGLEEIILCVHYKSDIIKSYFGEGRRWGVNITYSEEENPLGTAGAIKNAEKYLKQKFIVINGDSYSNVEINKLEDFHNQNKNAIGSLILVNAKDSSHYGGISLENNKIRSFLEKSVSGNSLVNGGFYLLEPTIFDYIPKDTKFSLENEVFPKLSKEEKLFGMLHEGYFMDIGRPDTYNQFKQDFLAKLIANEDITIKEAIEKLYENRTDLLLITNEDRALSGIINDNIIKRFIISGGDLSKKVDEAMVKNPEKIATVNNSEEEIQKILFSGTRHLPILDSNGKIKDIRFYNEEIKKENFPIIRGIAPLRISFGGGGTDLPFFFEKYGGAIISSTIDKYCKATAIKRADSKIVIDSDLSKEEIVLDSKNLEYDGKFNLLKAVYKIVNPGFGVDFHLTNDLPPGRGLGSSASFATLITKILGNLQGKEYDDQEIAEIAYRAEVEQLGIMGGKQDQYAAVFGGFNWIDFMKGDKKIMHPLRLRENTEEELRSHLTLSYTGQEHSSENQNRESKKWFEENEKAMALRLTRIKERATEIKESLLSAKPNFERIGELLNESWEEKRGLSPIMSNSKIDRIYELAMKNGSYGGKILGSGGGGYLILFHNPKKRNTLHRILQEEGMDLLNFNFENKGLRSWTVEN